MKMVKINVLLVILIISVCLSSCENPIIYERRPSKFPGSKWATENNQITFFVENIHVSLPKVAGTQSWGDNPYLWFFARGTIDIDGVKREVYFSDFAGSYEILIVSTEIEKLAETSEEYLFAQDMAELECFVAWIDWYYW